LQTVREVNRDQITAYNKQYWKENKERETEKHKAWVAENKDYIKQKNKEYREKHGKEIDKKSYQKRKNDPEYRVKFNEWRRNHEKERRKTDVHFRIKSNCSCRIREYLQDTKQYYKTTHFLGCLIDELKAYLESQFDERMSWENYGLNGWHIDHIVPCASFDLSKQVDQKRCFNFRNLQHSFDSQPLWGSENIAKSDTITEHSERVLEQLIELFPE
jgi:hypothetical protein